jgi:Fe-S-cluster containining protein
MPPGAQKPATLRVIESAPLPQMVPSRVCFTCTVCCRFPEADSFLRPYFTPEEMRRAVAAGLDPVVFPDPRGSQIRLVPNQSGEGYLCPAFDPATSHCRIYETRPLDCQIYPFALMWSSDRSEVLLGWDTKCPFLSGEGQFPTTLSPRGRGEGGGVETYAEQIACLIEADATLDLLARHPGLIGRFQDDVVILRKLPRLTARLCPASSPITHHPSPLTPHLSPLRLEDRPLLERAADSIVTPLAAYAFAPHYIWRHLFIYTWTTIAGHFCLFAEYSDGLFMPLPPLPLEPPSPRAGEHSRVPSPLVGEGRVRGDDFSDVLTACFALMRNRNKGSAVTRIENLPEELKPAFEAAGYRVKPKDPDYLYRASDLAALTGDRFKSQRAACNRFERTARYRVETYNQSHREGCLALLDRWLEQKRRQGVDALAEHLLSDAAPAHREALAHPEALGLTGTAVRVDGVIHAYSFESERSPSVACILLEVADREIPGLAQFLFRETSRLALRRGVVYINTMDDSGLRSLAQSKRAYRPLQLVSSFVATEP